jgi:hypothetical protein
MSGEDAKLHSKRVEKMYRTVPEIPFTVTLEPTEIGESVEDIFKTTLETSGEDAKTTPETSVNFKNS